MSCDDDENNAELLSLEAQAWVAACPKGVKCPLAVIFRGMVAQQKKIERLEHELKRVREFPDEN